MIGSSAPSIPMNSSSALCKVNRFLARLGGYLQCPLLLLIRLYWGWQFFLTGRGKWSDLSRPTAFFTSLHIPAPHLNAIIVAVTECVGGLMFAAGLGTRFVAPIFIFEMLVAYGTSEPEALHALFGQFDADKFVGAQPFQFLFAALIVFVFGPGKLALDTLVFKPSAEQS
jgi:putative oxidoreductase